MPKVAVNRATIVLTADGPWSWKGYEKTLTIEATTGNHPVSASGSPVLTPDDIIQAIKDTVAGEDYFHVPTATSKGSIGSADAFLDPGTDTSKLTSRGVPLATNATSGRFMVMAGTPSREPLPSGGEMPDAVLVHTGKWHVDDAATEKITVDQNNGDTAAEGDASHALATSPAFAADTSVAESENGAHADAPPNVALLIELSVATDPLLPFWAKAISPQTEIPLRGPDLTVKIGIAKLGDEGGIAARFRKTVRWSDLLEQDAFGAMQPRPVPVQLLLPPVPLDCDQPVWLTLEATTAGREHPASREQIGSLAAFSPADAKRRFLAPETPPQGFALPDGHETAWIAGIDALEQQPGATALALIAGAGDTGCWQRFRETPAMDTVFEPGMSLQLPAEYALEWNSEQDGTGGEPPRSGHFTPLRIAISPVFPASLAVRAAEPSLRMRLKAASAAQYFGAAQVMTAQFLEQYLPRMNLEGILRTLLDEAPSSGAIREGLCASLKPPDTVMALKEESGGLLTWPGPGTRIRPTQLFLHSHFAALRFTGAALCEESEVLPRVLVVNSDSEPALIAEQRLARLLTGYPAYEWRDLPGEPSEEQLERLGMYNLIRGLAPEWRTVSDTLQLGAEIFSLLRTIDTACEDAQAQRLDGLNDRSQAPPLLCPELKELWFKGLDAALEDDRGGVIGEMRERMDRLPLIRQAADLLDRAKAFPSVGAKITEFISTLSEASLVKAANELPPRLIREHTILQTFILVEYPGQRAFLAKAAARFGKPRGITMVSDIPGKLVFTQYRLETRVYEKPNYTWEGGLDEAKHALHRDPKGRVRVRRAESWHKPSKILEAGLDGVEALYLLCDLMARLENKKELTSARTILMIGYDILSLSTIAIKHGPLFWKGTGKLAKFANTVIAPLINVFDLCFAVEAAHDAWQHDRTDDMYGNLIVAVGTLGVLVLPCFGLAAATVVLVSAAISAVTATLREIYKSGPPKDLTRCIQALHEEVEKSPFGERAFRRLVAEQPEPASKVIAVSGGGTPHAIEIIQPPSDADRLWFASVREYVEPGNEDGLQRLISASVACEMTAVPVDVVLDRCIAPTPATAWLGNFQGSGRAAGTLVTGSARMLFGAPGPLRFNPAGAQVDSPEALALKVVPATRTSQLCVSVTRGDGTPGPACSIGLIRTSGQKARIRGLAIVVGVRTGPEPVCEIPPVIGKGPFELLFIIPDGIKGADKKRPGICVSDGMFGSVLLRREVRMDAAEIALSPDGDGMLVRQT